MPQIAYDILHVNHSKKEHIISLYLVCAIFFVMMGYMCLHLLLWFQLPSCFVLPLKLRTSFSFSFWGEGNTDLV
jgi:hypothetical protein